MTQTRPRRVTLGTFMTNHAPFSSPPLPSPDVHHSHNPWVEPHDVNHLPMARMVIPQHESLQEVLMPLSLPPLSPMSLPFQYPRYRHDPTRVDGCQLKFVSEQPAHPILNTTVQINDDLTNQAATAAYKPTATFTPSSASQPVIQPIFEPTPLSSNHRTSVLILASDYTSSSGVGKDDEREEKPEDASLVFHPSTHQQLRIQIGTSLHKERTVHLMPSHLPSSSISSMQQPPSLSTSFSSTSSSGSSSNDMTNGPLTASGKKTALRKGKKKKTASCTSAGVRPLLPLFSTLSPSELWHLPPSEGIRVAMQTHCVSTVVPHYPIYYHHACDQLYYSSFPQWHALETDVYRQQTQCWLMTSPAMTHTLPSSPNLNSYFPPSFYQASFNLGSPYREMGRDVMSSPPSRSSTIKQDNAWTRPLQN